MEAKWKSKSHKLWLWADSDYIYRYSTDILDSESMSLFKVGEMLKLKAMLKINNMLIIRLCYKSDFLSSLLSLGILTIIIVISDALS